MAMSPFSSSSLTYEPIARELDVGERLLWSGQPDPTRMRQKAIPTALFSIPCGAFMAFWIWGASAAARSTLASGRIPDVFFAVLPLSGLLGVGFVALMALAPWTEAAKARRTFYGLTDRRALVITEGKKKTVTSVMASEFSVERHDLGQRGDVILRRETKGTGEDETTVETGFYGIENAREVERMAHELAQSVR